VTGIELGLITGGAIYTGNILGDGITRQPLPNGGCTTLSGIKHTLTIQANERVTKLEAWRKTTDGMWTQIKITLNSGATQDYQAPLYSSSDTLHTFNIPSGEEFTGFGLFGTACWVVSMQVLTRIAVCSVSLNLSQVNGASQRVIIDATTTKTFTSTPSAECGTISFEY